MTYKVGDAVRIENNKTFSRGRGRVLKVLGPNAIAQDFQEYIVEFRDFHSQRFGFGLCREFEMLPDIPPLGIAQE